MTTMLIIAGFVVVFAIILAAAKGVEVEHQRVDEELSAARRMREEQRNRIRDHALWNHGRKHDERTGWDHK
jgi:hypothetical protein